MTGQHINPEDEESMRQEEKVDQLIEELMRELDIEMDDEEDFRIYSWLPNWGWLQTTVFWLEDFFMFALFGAIALLVLGVVGGIGYVLYETVTADAPESANPNFIDQILSSGIVLGAVRVAVLAAAAYVTLSVLVLISRNQWLVRVGPLAVSERTEEIKDAYQEVLEVTASQRDMINKLEEELDQSADIIAELLDDERSDPNDQE